jgi:hypothetical protein
MRERLSKALVTRVRDTPSSMLDNYEAEDAIALVLRDGRTFVIPRSTLAALAGVPAATLSTISITPDREAICWRSLDVYVAVRALVDRTGHQI